MSGEGRLVSFSLFPATLGVLNHSDREREKKREEEERERKGKRGRENPSLNFARDRPFRLVTISIPTGKKEKEKEEGHLPYSCLSRSIEQRCASWVR